MKHTSKVIAAGALLAGLLSACACRAQMDDKYQPNAESKKYPEGSAIERKVRMAAIAKNPAYTRKFDLSALPDYVPEGKPTGTLRVALAVSPAPSALALAVAEDA